MYIQQESKYKKDKNWRFIFFITISVISFIICSIWIYSVTINANICDATIQEGKHIISRWDGMGCKNSIMIFLISFFSIISSIILIKYN